MGSSHHPQGPFAPHGALLTREAHPASESRYGGEADGAHRQGVDAIPSPSPAGGGSWADIRGSEPQLCVPQSVFLLWGYPIQVVATAQTVEGSGDIPSA